jgi:hypothetical protein
MRRDDAPGKLSGVSLDGVATGKRIHGMDRQTVTERLTAHRAELEAMGVTSLSLFGSTARRGAGG